MSSSHSSPSQSSRTSRSSRLVLFDIDGTLIHAGGYATRAYQSTFRQVFGVAPSITSIRLSGKTDREILIELLATEGFGRDRVEPELGRVFDLYRGHLEREVGSGDEIRLLPGVRPLLRAVEARGATLGLVTGNTESGARIKLSPHGLNRYFPFGGFGDESEVRSDLVDLACRRAEERAGRAFHGKDVVIVGDSPRDVECGRHRGVTCVAVATGWTQAAELAAAGADSVLASFEDVDAAVAAILGS